MRFHALSLFPPWFFCFRLHITFTITWYSSDTALSKLNIITLSGFHLETSCLTRLLAGFKFRTLCYRIRKIPSWTSLIIVDTVQSSRLQWSGCDTAQGRQKLDTQFGGEASWENFKCKSKQKEIKIKKYLKWTSCENAVFGNYPRTVPGFEFYYWSTEHVTVMAVTYSN